MLVQEMSQDFLCNLKNRLDFEIEIRSFVIDYDSAKGGNPWRQPMYLIPMYNIVEKLKSFESYFNKLDVSFPTFEVYRQPFDLSTAFPNNMIHIKEEEFIFKGENIKVEYNYII